MGYTVSFLHNETYGVSHMNRITQRLTGSGISTFPVLEEYSTTDLNTVTSGITESGVTYNESSCKVVKDGDASFKIMGGSAFFADGVAVDIDTNGVILPIQSGKNYIYLKRDSTTNTISPVASNTPPTSTDIPLGEYKEGELKDVRRRAVSKIEGFGQPSYYKKILSLTLAPSAETAYIFDDLTRDYRYVMLFDDAASQAEKKFLGWGDMETGKYWSATADYNGASMLDFGGDQILLYHDFNVNIRWIRFVKDGMNIKMMYHTTLSTNYQLNAQVLFA